MVIDASKGVEAQTIKLFKVCVMRNIPIFTFINKMDREARDPFELMDEIESVLGIKTCPINWPIGCGKNFKGVYDRNTQENHYLYSRYGRCRKRWLPENLIWSQTTWIAVVGADYHSQLLDDIELLDGASEEFDMEQVQHRKAVSCLLRIGSD